MQLSTRDGIACDQCGTTHKHDFTYYSFDFRPLAMQGGRRPSLDMIHSSLVTFSADVCPACFEKVKVEVVKNYSKMMSAKRQSKTNDVCELTGQVLSGNCLYYHINVTKVEVKTSNQPSVCQKCKASTFDHGKPCAKCGFAGLNRPAAITTDERFVEFNVTEAVHKQFTDAASTMRQVAGQWATKS